MGLLSGWFKALQIKVRGERVGNFAAEAAPTGVIVFAGDGVFAGGAALGGDLGNAGEAGGKEYEGIAEFDIRFRMESRHSVHNICATL